MTTGGDVMVREFDTASYYRAHAKQLRELADEHTKEAIAIAFRHMASNFDTSADWIDIVE